MVDEPPLEWFFKLVEGRPDERQRFVAVVVDHRVLVHECRRGGSDVMFLDGASQVELNTLAFSGLETSHELTGPQSAALMIQRTWGSRLSIVTPIFDPCSGASGLAGLSRFEHGCGVASRQLLWVIGCVFCSAMGHRKRDLRLRRRSVPVNRFDRGN